jgi:S-adenosyl-L-methionine hydrolase (adenosine-forming)
VIITLLTDFGERDGFTGVMKGVILGICPGAALVDLSHHVEPGDVGAGALILRAAVPYFPPGSIHLAVVDPGVGGDRRAVAFRAGGQWLVGPDNGLLWPAAAWLAERAGEPRPEARLLDNPAYRLPQLSHTFHGRDLFAPAAAHLARGVAWESIGPPVAEPVQRRIPTAQRAPAAVEGEVLALDRFGNAITNVAPADVAALGEHWLLEAGSACVTGPATHYGAVPEGEPVVVLDSFGFYELAVNRGSAAKRYGLTRGDRVTVRPITDARSGS